jgi:tRNA-modifying protein YgfZ
MNNSNALPYTFVRFNGPDTVRFLQGQLSCDVAALEDSGVTFGTANTPKGRIYLLFVLFRDGEDYVMRIHESVAKDGLDTLAKYMVFFKCEMVIQEHLKAYPSARGVTENQPMPSSFKSVSKLDQGYLWKCPGQLERYEIWSEHEPTEKQNQSAIQDQWFAQDCAAGIPELYPETKEQFILQQLNLDQLEAVSFKKGCYTGQEIIARMKFLGKLKKKMFLITTEHWAVTVPGAAIFDDTGKKTGDVVRWHQNGDSGIGLAVLEISAVEAEQTFFLDAESTNLMHIKNIDY